MNRLKMDQQGSFDARCKAMSRNEIYKERRSNGKSETDRQTIPS